MSAALLKRRLMGGVRAAGVWTGIMAGIGAGVLAGFTLPAAATTVEGALPPGLQVPPKYDYAKLCKQPPALLPLAMNWTDWQGGEVTIPTDRMLADAIRLTDGGNDVHRNRPLARKLLEYIAAGTSISSPEAKRRLAGLLLDPTAGETDPERAVHLLNEAMVSQRVDAALALGRLIMDQKVPGQTPEDAARYLGMAASLGDPAAALELAAYYASPDAKAPFDNAAAHFATLAVIAVQTALAAGDCSVGTNVGQYLLNHAPEAGAVWAVNWFEIAANAGDARAMDRLARAYARGDGVAVNAEQAQRLWDRAAAAGLVSAMPEAAKIRLRAGRQVPEALKLLDVGMANGDSESFLQAARFYHGDFSDTANFDAMQPILVAAAARPDVSIDLLDMLARSYMSGQGVAPDPGKAGEIYRRILRSGDPRARELFAQYLVRHGLGLDKAIDHLQIAAASGSADAQFDLAEIAACSPVAGVDADLMMKTAADGGNTAAMRRLARRALETNDLATAQSHLRRAAELGDRLAMVELAVQAQKAGTPDDKLIVKALLPGDGMAGGRLAVALAYGRGKLGEDAGKSEQMLESLADSGDPDVDVELAKRALAVDPFDMAKADDVERRLKRAALSGDAEAMLLLSRFTQAVKGDAAGAAEWLVRAAERGDPTALGKVPNDGATVTRVLAGLKELPICDVQALVHKMRMLRLQGDGAAAEQVLKQAMRIADHRPRDLYIVAQDMIAAPNATRGDYEQAASLLAHSAESGYDRAALALANLYGGGRLGDRSKDAIVWYSKAAVTGDLSAIRTLSRYASLASSDTNGKFALEALRQIAVADVTAAMRVYGALLASQNAERHAEGLAFLQRAAEKGDVDAMKTLAQFYAAGITGEISANESTKWTRMAAERGDPEAMFRYAIALDLGFGVSADPKSAKTWHDKAVKNGFVQ